MQVGMIGLGRMGMNMARRLLTENHQVIVYNRTQEKVEQMVKEGAIGSASLEELVQKLSPPRVVWMMYPAGELVDETTSTLSSVLSEGDILVEGGNSYCELPTTKVMGFLLQRRANWRNQ